MKFVMKYLFNQNFHKSKLPPLLELDIYEDIKIIIDIIY